jgi:long-subunit acyl-CoA synthetase (AMP-forming)
MVSDIRFTSGTTGRPKGVITPEEWLRLLRRLGRVLEAAG